MRKIHIICLAASFFLSYAPAFAVPDGEETPDVYKNIPDQVKKDYFNGNEQAFVARMWGKDFQDRNYAPANLRFEFNQELTDNHKQTHLIPEGTYVYAVYDQENDQVGSVWYTPGTRLSVLKVLQGNRDRSRLDKYGNALNEDGTPGEHPQNQHFENVYFHTNVKNARNPEAD